MGLSVDELVFWSGIPLHGQAFMLDRSGENHGLARGASYFDI